MSMKLRERGVPPLLLALAFSMLIGASAPRNPLVVRTAAPRGAVPADCDAGLSPTPASVRPDVSRVSLPPATTDLTPPPQRTLRGELGGLHAALLANDRISFDAHLAALESMLPAYPAGGEKTAAENLLQVYRDAARIWDAQFVAPFFDAQSPEYAIVSAYPGYEEAVRKGVLLDDRERRFYPATESRAFLARIAAERLPGIGVTAPAPQRRPRVIRTETVTPQRSGAVADSSAPSQKTPATKRSATRSSSAPKKSRSTPQVTSSHAASTPGPAKREPSPALAAPRAAVPATTASAPPAVVAKSEVEPAKPPAAVPSATPPAATATTPVATATTPVATATTPVPPATTPVATASAPVPSVSAPVPGASETTGATPAETATTATETTASATDSAATPAGERKSMMLPIVLILIGIGVLLLLFRASD
jgi:hypothetical protein